MRHPSSPLHQAGPHADLDHSKLTVREMLETGKGKVSGLEAMIYYEAWLVVLNHADQTCPIVKYAMLSSLQPIPFSPTSLPAEKLVRRCARRGE